MKTRDWQDYIRCAVAADYNIAIDPPVVVTGNAGEKKLALKDDKGQRDIAFRILQNTGAVDAYFTVGSNNVDQAQKVYHGKIAAGQSMDFSMSDKEVWVTSNDGAFEVAPMVGARI